MKEAIDMILLEVFPEAPMLAVRWYLLAIADCMCLDLYDFVLHFCSECKTRLIDKITTEEDYSDFYILYGYLLVINKHYQ